jgi:hypothetical protein
MKVFERLMFLANGGRKSYQHKNGKENKNTTKLQDLLSEVMKRQNK